MNRLFGEGIYLLKHVFVLLVIFLLLRGHHHPGGGFIAGVLATVLYLLIGLTKETYGGKGLTKLPHFTSLIPVGILTSVSSGFLGLFFNGSLFSSVTICELGEFILTSEFIFDLGVFFLVTGAGTKIFDNFIHYGR
ncbi:MAG: MnhB domain-containing protein [Deltaproteobacteria bacterium]|nr:MnhB domain-containing protein [Deltaproteobacteria bacterium]MCX7952091.1 MnhB domain-containing protein [Deltaproteobacteria bacterium]